MLDAFCVLGQLPPNGPMKQMKFSFWATQFVSQDVDYGSLLTMNDKFVPLVAKHLEQFKNKSLLREASPEFLAALFAYCNQTKQTIDKNTHRC